MLLEFPKWVVPHESHIVRDALNAVLTVPLFPDFHVDRAGDVTVLVKDAAHEALALAAKVEAEVKTLVAEIHPNDDALVHQLNAPKVNIDFVKVAAADAPKPNATPPAPQVAAAPAAAAKPAPEPAAAPAKADAAPGKA